jgi:hypothetical protein
MIDPIARIVDCVGRVSEIARLRQAHDKNPHDVYQRLTRLIRGAVGPFAVLETVV